MVPEGHRGTQVPRWRYDPSVQTRHAVCEVSIAQLWHCLPPTVRGHLHCAPPASVPSLQTNGALHSRPYRPGTYGISPSRPSQLSRQVLL